jgi:uncharacterized protein YjbJ (UPF0337 family)
MEKQQSGGCQCGTPDHQTKDCMKSGTQDKLEGAFHEVKGAIKKVAGELTDNPKLKAEGNVEKIAGKVQGKVGQVKQVFGK